MREITIGENEAGQRLDRFLLKYLDKSTRPNIFKLIRKKCFKVNGARVKEEYFLKNEDILSIYLSEETLQNLITPVKRHIKKTLPSDMPIVFENDDILVVNKPSGLLTHPDKAEYKKTAATYVLHYLNEFCTKTFKPAPAHRLDKNTSGILLFCKNYDSLKKYTKLIKERNVRKFYQCIVHGKIKDAGEIQGFLYKDEQRNQVYFSSVKKNNDYKSCNTSYIPLAENRDFTLLEIELKTGRSHQIRASMQYIGHPIIGDSKYGGKKIFGHSVQLLHAMTMVVEDQVFKCTSPEIENLWNKLEGIDNV